MHKNYHTHTHKSQSFNENADLKKYKNRSSGEPTQGYIYILHRLYSP